MTGEQGAPIADGSYEEYLALYSAIDRQRLATASDHWEAVAGALTDVAGGLGASRDGLLANGGWSSEAANTFGAYMDTLVQQTQGLSTAAAVLSGGLRHATNTADQLANNNFPPQPPPPSDDPTVRNWTLRDGTTMQGTATDVRNHMTYQARKAVIAVYDDYSHASQRMAEAQAAAPVPSSGFAPVGNTDSSNPGGSSFNPGGGARHPAVAGQRAGESAAASTQTTSAAQQPVRRGVTGEPQPEVSPLMIAQGSGTGSSSNPWSSPVGGNRPNNGALPFEPTSSGSPFGIGGVPSGGGPVQNDTGGSPIGGDRSRASRAGTFGEEPGIIGGRAEAVAPRKGSGSPYSAAELGDGIVGGIPEGGSGSGVPGSSRGSRRGFGVPEGAAGEGEFASGGPRGIGEGPFGEAGRLGASMPEERVPQRVVGQRGSAPIAPEESPFYPSGGMGGLGSQNERERGKRPRYLVQDPSYWESKKPVVPPVIE